MAALPLRDTRTHLNESKTTHGATGGFTGDLTAFSKEQLAVMNQVLTAVLHSRNFEGLLSEIYAALNKLQRLDGCALYWMSDSGMNLRLAYGVGEYKSFLPDSILQGSDLFKWISAKSVLTKDFSDMAFSNAEQLSLFDDHPLSLFCPIVVDEVLVGALAAIHGPDNTGFLQVIFNEAAMALELLHRADTTAGALPIGARLAVNRPSRDGSGTVPAGEDGQAKLTVREKEVLGLLAEGLSNKEIAEKLFISPATCKHHVQNILAKLQVRSRAAAVAVGFAYADNETHG